MADKAKKKLPKYVMDEYQTLFRVKRVGDCVKFSQLDSKASITTYAEDFDMVLARGGFHELPPPIEKILDQHPGQEQKFMHSIVACYKQSLLTNGNTQSQKETTNGN